MSRFVRAYKGVWRATYPLSTDEDANECPYKGNYYLPNYQTFIINFVKIKGNNRHFSEKIKGNNCPYFVKIKGNDGKSRLKNHLTIKKPEPPRDILGPHEKKQIATTTTVSGVTPTKQLCFPG